MQLVTEKLCRLRAVTNGERCTFRLPLSPAWSAVNLWIALPYIQLVRNRAPATANGVRSPESPDVKADRSALWLGAGSARDERNIHGRYHLMNCARHDPHHARVPPPLIEP